MRDINHAARGWRAEEIQLFSKKGKKGNFHPDRVRVWIFILFSPDFNGKVSQDAKAMVGEYIPWLNQCRMYLVSTSIKIVDRGERYGS